MIPKKQGKRQVYPTREALPLLFGQDRKYSAAEERVRKDSMSADKLEIEVQKLRGELVDRPDVFHAWESMLVAIRDRLLSMPPRIVPLLQDRRPQRLLPAKSRPWTQDDPEHWGVRVLGKCDPVDCEHDFLIR